MLNFNQIYSDNYDEIFIFVQRKVKSKELAEEIVNDVFVNVHKHLNNFDNNKSSLKTWLYNIAKNIVIDNYRKKRIKTYSLDELHDDEKGENKTKFETPDKELNGIETLIVKEQMNLVKGIVQSLPIAYRRIANMFFFEQLSYEEISNELDMPLGTVKGKIHRTRELLKKRMSRN